MQVHTRTIGRGSDPRDRARFYAYACCREAHTAKRAEFAMAARNHAGKKARRVVAAMRVARVT